MEGRFGIIPTTRKVYEIMPTQEELQNNLYEDYNDGIFRVHELPSSQLNISGKFTIPPGIGIVGQYWYYSDSHEQGTRILLDEDGQICFDIDGNKSSNRLSNVNIIQDDNAITDGIVIDDESGEFQLKNIRMGGGNSDVWAIHVNDAYEMKLETIKLYTKSNGLYLDADGPYNSGDGGIYDVHVRMRSLGTTGLKIDAGEVGHYNNTPFYGFYATAADLGAAWETGENIGINMDGVTRTTFISPNIEECDIGMQLANCQYITMVGGWIYDGIIAGSGNTNTIKLLNTQITGSITGETAGYVTRI